MRDDQSYLEKGGESEGRHSASSRTLLPEGKTIGPHTIKSLADSLTTEAEAKENRRGLFADNVSKLVRAYGATAVMPHLIAIAGKATPNQQVILEPVLASFYESPDRAGPVQRGAECLAKPGQ